MKDGAVFVARFKERDARHVYFMDHEAVDRGKIVSFTIVKGL